MESQKLRFLEASVLGMTDFENSENVIKSCVARADRDMLTSGRFYLTKNSAENRRQDFIEKLEGCGYKFSRDLIDRTAEILEKDGKLSKNDKGITSYGLSQKLVNMTYKYFYIFSKYIKKSIDFSKCDCPLDSIILDSLNKNKIPWSKLSKDDYEDIQNEITKESTEYPLYKEAGNLAYDFEHWLPKKPK